MSSSPTQQPHSSAIAFSVTYNGAEAGEQAAVDMAESWKAWEGEVVDGEFPLRQYLGGSARRAVFLTERGPHAEPAAIRLVPGDSGQAQEQASRWEQAARLHHPNLLRIFQSGKCELNGAVLHYLVTEYAEENLSQILLQRALTPAETSEMLQPLLDALAFVHGQGFSHGHVKPANIMAIADQLKISSDTLCREGSPATEEDSEYDPPEVGSGRTPAGDFWSLGVTLVEVLMLRRPQWDAARGEAVLPEGMPQPFLDITRHCLRSAPEHRWTVAEIKARLQLAAPEKPGHVALKSPVALAPEKPLHGKLPGKRSYLVPAVMAALIVIALVALRIHYSPPAAPYPQVQQAEVPLSETPASAPPPKQAKPAPDIPDKGQSPATNPVPAVPSKAEQEAKPSPAEPPASSASPAMRVEPKTTGQPANPVPGSVLRQVLPDVPRSAQNTIEGHVRVSVKVSVDASGNVTQVVLDSPGPSRYFARLAQQAAREWKFVSPERDGQKVSSAWILHFAFGRAGTEVHAESVAR